MQINPNIFRAYDIRGIAVGENGNPAEINEETAYLIGKGAGTYLQKISDTKSMAVGADVRLTSPALKKAYIRGVTETGIDVTDVGLSISPMIYWSVCAKYPPNIPFDSATNITASHNPKEYNGFKIVGKNAHSICGEELQEVLKLIQKNELLKAPTPGKVRKFNIEDEYLEDLAKKVKINRKIKVVVDAGNGAASYIGPKFLKKIGCEVVELFCEADGNFPNHEANPEELKNMEDLMQKVKETNADLGIGFDGDGDRVGVVDENGKMYSSDFMLFLLAQDLLSRIPGAQIVFDVKVSQVIIDKIAELGGIPIMSKTGHSFIEGKMKEIGAPLAGEVSGHLFFGENYYGFDDALLGAGKIIEILANSELPLSKMFYSLAKVHTTPEYKIPCPDDKKFEIVKNLVNHFTKLYDCITIDGVRINFGGKAWGAIRASNTSPNLTLRFEAKTEEKLEEIKDIVFAELKKHPQVALK
jgi:phosphomannomutase / phosphoglucomutase